MTGRLFGSLRGYRREWARGGLIANLTVWAVPVVTDLISKPVMTGVAPLAHGTQGKSPLSQLLRG